MGSKQRMSALDGLIRAGQADPITDEERQIVAGLRESLERRTRGRVVAKSAVRGDAKLAS